MGSRFLITRTIDFMQASCQTTKRVNVAASFAGEVSAAAPCKTHTTCSVARVGDIRGGEHGHKMDSFQPIGHRLHRDQPSGSGQLGLAWKLNSPIDGGSAWCAASLLPPQTCHDRCNATGQVSGYQFSGAGRPSSAPAAPMLPFASSNCVRMIVLPATTRTSNRRLPTSARPRNPGVREGSFPRKCPCCPIFRYLAI